jgi:hypothetical protein
MDMYVYYSVDSGRAEALRTRVAAMQATLAAAHDVVTALKRRPGEKNGRHTWMEVYLAVPDGFDSMLEQAVDRAELTTLIDGERHTEYFLDIAPCA